jgi:hypothetical protein
VILENDAMIKYVAKSGKYEKMLKLLSKLYGRPTGAVVKTIDYYIPGNLGQGILSSSFGG